MCKVQSDEDFIVSDDHDGATSIASSEQGGSAGVHSAQVGLPSCCRPNTEAQACLLRLDALFFSSAPWQSEPANLFCPGHSPFRSSSHSERQSFMTAPSPLPCPFSLVTPGAGDRAAGSGARCGHLRTTPTMRERKLTMRTMRAPPALAPARRARPARQASARRRARARP